MSSLTRELSKTTIEVRLGVGASTYVGWWLGTKASAASFIESGAWTSLDSQ